MKPVPNTGALSLENAMLRGIEYSWLAKTLLGSPKSIGETVAGAVSPPAEQKGGVLRLCFHDPSGPSRAYRIDVKHAGDADRTTVETVQDNARRDRIRKLDVGKPYTAIRVWQDAGDGSVGRPDLLWLSQAVME